MNARAFILAVILGGTLIVPNLAQAMCYDYGCYGYYDPYPYYEYYEPYYYEDVYYYPQYHDYYYPSQYSYPAYYPSYPSYGYGYSTPSPYNYSYPVGDTDTFGSDICYWEGYGRGLCDFNPRQPVYDHWTGTWY